MIRIISTKIFLVSAFFALFICVCAPARSQDRIVLSGGAQSAVPLDGPLLIYGKPCDAAAFSPDGRFLYLGEISDNKLIRFDLKTMKQVDPVNLPDAPLNIAFDKSGSRLIVAYDDRIEILKTTDWSVLASIPIAQNEFPASLSAASILIVQKISNSSARYVLSRIVADGKTVSVPKQANLEFDGGIGETPDGKYALLGGDGFLKVVDLKSFETVKTLSLKAHSFSGRVDVITVSPDGRFFCVCNKDSLPAQYRFGSWKFVGKLTSNGNRSGVSAVAYSSNSKRIVTLNLCSEIQFWSSQTAGLLNSGQANTAEIAFICASNDFRSLLIIDADNCATIWKIP